MKENKSELMKDLTEWKVLNIYILENLISSKQQSMNNISHHIKLHRPTKLLNLFLRSI